MTTADLHEQTARDAARDRIAVASGVALLAAGLILVCAVLPAEYGVDPLGIGAKLGLTAIGDVRKSLDAFQASQGARAAGAPIVTPKERAFRQETVDFTIAAHDSVEYKYRLDRNDALLYSWKATAPVAYELHAEPDGAPRGYAESFEKKSASAGASGTLTAPFAGIHGWYWENSGDAPVTVTLSSAGFYTMAHEFRKGAAPKTKIFQ